MDGKAYCQQGWPQLTPKADACDGAQTIDRRRHISVSFVPKTKLTRFVASPAFQLSVPGLDDGAGVAIATTL